jgi:hypothetical protein
MQRQTGDLPADVQAPGRGARQRPQHARQGGAASRRLETVRSGEAAFHQAAGELNGGAPLAHGATDDGPAAQEGTDTP